MQQANGKSKAQLFAGLSSCSAGHPLGADAITSVPIQRTAKGAYVSYPSRHNHEEITREQ